MVIIETAIVIVERPCSIERVIGIGRRVIAVGNSRHFSIFTALNVESKVLIDLEFVNSSMVPELRRWGEV